MNKMSLRTRGIIFIFFITVIPLLLAGVNNYSATRESILQAEIEVSSNQQLSRAKELSSWMETRRAEVFVMSRTALVRFGSNNERIKYFNEELSRNSSIYSSIGYIDKNGLAVRTNGEPVLVKEELFFQKGIQGESFISDPYVSPFADQMESIIAVPVYNAMNQVQGVIYTSIPFSLLQEFLTYKGEGSVIQLINDVGRVIFDSGHAFPGGGNIFDSHSPLSHVADELMAQDVSMVLSKVNGRDYAVFHTKVSDTPWRFVLNDPVSALEEKLPPLFWRMFTTIAISEIIILVFFYLYFEWIIKRLQKILSVTEQAAAGIFETEHLEVEPHDEVGQLAHSVNGMMKHLQEMVDRLHAIINQNQYGFIVLDDQYKIVSLNKTAEQLLGYKSEELAGTATPLVFMDHAEIEALAEEMTILLGREVPAGLEVLKELRKRHFSYEREWTFIHKDGTKIPILQSANGLRDRNGRYAGSVGIIHDISLRKQAEKTRNRLLNIVESAQDLIASVDTNGKVIYMNLAGRLMLGLGDVEKKNYGIKRYIHPRKYKELLLGVEQSKIQGYWEGGTLLLKNSGDPFHVSLTIVAHQEEDTGKLFFSCIARDITEQQRVQEELVRASLEAEEANQTKSRFLALMSHEIRTPLNGIIGLTQLMHKTGLSASQKDYIDKMNTSSETLLRIINDILDFSKIEAGKIEAEQISFQPEELLRRLTDQLSVFMGGKEQFEFIIDTPDNLPRTMIGDPLRLEQVLLNLSMNAIKFTNEGRVRLKLTMLKAQDTTVWIQFSVDDTGIGMGEQQVEKLFQPFTQADSSTTRRFGGTGLGLVISRTFVELMGGELTVESKEGQGSRFSFTLSFEIVHQHQLQDIQYPAIGNEREQHVWVVEDDEEMGLHWYGILADCGLTPIIMSSWEMARNSLLRELSGSLPKLIILDMEMPDMYGVETWLQFHQETKNVGIQTIAITTSYGRDEMLQLPASQRPYQLLVKPVLRPLMVQAIKGALDLGKGESNATEGLVQAAVSLERGANKRILLAEDNKINQLVAVELLKDHGYDVGLAENGQEVLDMLKEESWDLILMDIHMPIMDGPEAALHIRSQVQYDHIPIIALTANVLRNDHERYLRKGMNDVITKPIDSVRLHDVISYWLKADSDSLVVHTKGAEGKPRGQLAINNIPPISGMNVESALARVNGKKNILIRMLEQFLFANATFTDDLRMKINLSDIDTAKRMLHTLKGSAGYLSAYVLQDQVTFLESMLKLKASQEEMSAAIDKMDTSLKQLFTGIQAFVKYNP